MIRKAVKFGVPVCRQTPTGQGLRGAHATGRLLTPKLADISGTQNYISHVLHGIEVGLFRQFTVLVSKKSRLKKHRMNFSPRKRQRMGPPWEVEARKRIAIILATATVSSADIGKQLLSCQCCQSFWYRFGGS